MINRDSGDIVAEHGGKLHLGVSGKTTDLGIWINQGRAIDAQTIEDLNNFIAQI